MKSSKDILNQALNHRETVKIPFDLGSTKMTGISYTAYKNYLAQYELTRLDGNPQIFDMLQQLAKPSEAFLRHIGVDVRGVFPHTPSSWQASYTDHADSIHMTDEWGIEWKMPKDHGLYFDLFQSPMANAEITPHDVEHLKWPNPDDELRFSTLKAQVDNIEGNGAYGVTMHGMTSGALEMALRIRGFEGYFMDMLAEPVMAEILLDKIVDIKIGYWNKALTLVGDHIDVVIEADDLGTQNSLLISPEIYRNMVKPRHQRLFSAIKKKAPHAKVFLHSCGAVRQLIPDFIEAGVDILNPVQLSASGMDARELKRTFGDDLVFWGGGVDTQLTLPYGTPDEVKEEVKRRIDIFAPGGGFVFSTIHNIQADVPPENLQAMLESINSY